MIFQFVVTQIAREDKLTAKVYFEGHSKAGRFYANVLVPFDELKNYEIDDKFILLPEGTPIDKVQA